MDCAIEAKSKSPRSAPLLPRHIKQALDYIRANRGEKITLAGLASACGAPERTLLKQFERFLGRRLRLNEARSELLERRCKDSIAEIAVRCRHRVLPAGPADQRGERLRVIVRLVDMAADRRVWGDSFDGSMVDPFELQNRVVDQVFCNVVAHIADAQIERANHKDQDDLVVHELVLQALPLILDANAASARNAAAILRRAVDIDPADATATALLASASFSSSGITGLNRSALLSTPATVQHGADEPGTRKLWNHSRNRPSASRGGAATADAPKESAAIRQEKRIWSSDRMCRRDTVPPVAAAIRAPHRGPSLAQISPRCSEVTAGVRIAFINAR